MRSPLEQWTLDGNKYIKYWHWFLSCDIHTIHQREHVTCWKYPQPLNRTIERRHIVFQTDTKSVSQRPSCYQVCTISLITRSPTYLQIKSTGLDFPPEPSGPPMKSSEEGGTSDSQLHTAFKRTKNQHKWMVPCLTFSDKLDILYNEFTSRQVRAGSDGI